jgi:hypothetical protein
MTQAIEQACTFALTHTTTKGVEVHTYEGGAYAVTVTERVPYGQIYQHNHPGPMSNPGESSLMFVKQVDG